MVSFGALLPLLPLLDHEEGAMPETRFPREIPVTIAHVPCSIQTHTSSTLCMETETFPLMEKADGMTACSFFSLAEAKLFFRKRWKLRSLTVLT